MAGMLLDPAIGILITASVALLFASAGAHKFRDLARFDEIFSAEPMAHWYEVFNGVHVTFGAVRGPQEVINDPQLQANDIIVPLTGAGGKLTSTISSPLQVHGIAKVPAKRAPKIGEHNEEVLRQLGFSATEIDGLHASGAIPKAKEHAA